MKTLFTSSVAFLALATAPAFAAFDPNCTNTQYAAANPTKCSTVVPEISAMEGTAALAAIAAIVLITWERRRRAAA